MNEREPRPAGTCRAWTPNLWPGAKQSLPSRWPRHAPLRRIRLFPVASLSLIYMTAVVVVASRRGLGPAIATAVLGVLRLQLPVHRPALYLPRLASGRAFDAGPVPCGIADHRQPGRPVARAGRRAGRHRDRTNKLYDFSRRVAAAATADDVIWASVSHVASDTALRIDASDAARHAPAVNCRSSVAFRPKTSWRSATSPPRSSPGTRANRRGMDRTPCRRRGGSFCRWRGRAAPWRAWASPLPMTGLLARTDRPAAGRAWWTRSPWRWSGCA